MIWALIPNWLKYSLAALVAAFLLLTAGYLAGKREGRQQAVSEQLRETVKAEKERGKDDENYAGLRIMILCSCPSSSRVVLRPVRRAARVETE